MPDSDALIRAMACLPPARLAKAHAARLRYERRQRRLQRLAAEREQRRDALLRDPIARALAKAHASAERNDDTGDSSPP